MLASVKALLNKFSLSQPALNDRSKPFPSSAIQLGDVIDAAQSEAQGSADDAEAAQVAAEAARDAAEGFRDEAETFKDEAEAAATYTAGTPADWAGAAPTTVSEALDRLAAANPGA